MDHNDDALFAPPRALSRLRPRPRSLLIVGASALGRHTAHLIQERTRSAASFHCLSFPGEALHYRLPGPLLGTSDDLERVLYERPFDEVYIAGSSLRHGAAMQSAVRVCERVGVPFALPVTHFRLERARPADCRAIADGYVHYRSAEHRVLQRALKRAFDVTASILGLIVLSPLLLAVALLVAITSRGPILFRQERMGRHGQRFSMLKFRSMVVDAEAQQQSLMARNEQDGPAFKIRRDPRVTRIGRVLRKYSIDELPQLFNVLAGDMSIVGPRPPLPAEVAKYEPWQRRRLSVRPGITCVWQVSGRNEISFEEWMYLDMRYIDHWSLAEDLRLILKTVPIVVTGRGAS